MVLLQCQLWKPWNSELVLLMQSQDEKVVRHIKKYYCFERFMLLILMLPDVSLLKLPVITTTIPLAVASFSSCHHELSEMVLLLARGGRGAGLENLQHPFLSYPNSILNYSQICSQTLF